MYAVRTRFTNLSLDCVLSSKRKCEVVGEKIELVVQFHFAFVNRAVILKEGQGHVTRFQNARSVQI